MLIQCIAAGQDDDLCVKMIKSHLGNLEKKNYQAIARDLKQPLEEIYEAAKVIMDFDPRPGRQYSSDDPHYVTPDVYIHKVGDKYFVVPNDDGLPKLKISGFYKNAMGNSAASKDYVQDKLRSAQWLIRSIQQRQRTIIKVAESILKFQREFFDKGIAHLKPLILRDVAEDIGMHESTVSRVTTSKYVHRGAVLHLQPPARARRHARCHPRRGAAVARGVSRRNGRSSAAGGGVRGRDVR